MEELAFPAWARWRLWWALLLGASLLAFALWARELWSLLLGVLLLGAFALHFRRTGYAVALRARGAPLRGQVLSPGGPEGREA